MNRLPPRVRLGLMFVTAVAFVAFGLGAKEDLIVNSAIPSASHHC
jgi:hypothetical protein